MPENQKNISEAERFEELLPFYLTGQLTADEKKFVDSCLAEDPSARDAYQFSQKIFATVKSTGSNRDAEASFEKLLARCSPEKRDGLYQRLKLWLGDLGLTPALATALLVIILQTAVVAVHLVSEHYENGNFTVTSARSEKADARLLVKSSAEAGALLAAIHQFDARIVHSSIGEEAHEIFIRIEDRMRLKPLIDMLIATGLIEEAVLLL